MIALALLATPAAADPILEAPVPSAIAWGGGARDVGQASLLAEVTPLGVLGAEDDTHYPDRERVLEGGKPVLGLARVGLAGALRCVPLVGVVRVDFAEATVDGFTEGPWGAVVSLLVDDLYLRWSPSRAAELQLGRGRVPFSKLRQFEEADLPMGSIPFVVEATAPDRRWGLTYLGDLGAVSYAAGAYVDLDELEPRGLADPSAGGAALAVVHAEWTPIAPMYGSNPPGRVAGARGPLPTPANDPWFRHVRVSAGFGGLARLRADGSAQLDGAVSLHLKWRRVALLGEMLLVDASELRLWGELGLMPLDSVALSARGEWQEDLMTATFGIAYFATKNRRNKLALVGWIRRGDAIGDEADGVVAVLQATL